jgi:2-haloacid dehalogenase
MKITLAFDVYGTLLNTHGVVIALENLIGNKAQAFSLTWRDKQLEYSFRRGLMKSYDIFPVCISDALDYTCLYYKTSFTIDDKNKLLNIYRALPAFDDAITSLQELKKTDNHLYAFSNGPIVTIEKLLTTANLREYFLDIISVDSIKTFKPSPDVYEHFVSAANAEKDNAWLISSNSFDVIGAVSAGMKAAWVQRSKEAIFDPWGIEPTIRINSLFELKEKITEYYKEQ